MIRLLREGRKLVKKHLKIRLLAGVNHRHHHVNAFVLALLSSFEHGVSFTNASGIAEKDF